MTIQFGGLASGLDTNSIVSQLMRLERMPINQLEADKTWMNNRLAAFTDLDSRMKSFLDSIENLGNADTLKKRSVNLSSNDHLTASVSSAAMIGTSYQVEVISLAQVQKSVSGSGFADRESNSFNTGTIQITVGNENHTIDITSENNSLNGIVAAINAANLGVRAAIINDGSNTGSPPAPYRLVLTGENVASDFSLDASGLNIGTGTDTLGVFEAPGGIINPPVQVATRANLMVDGIEIFSDSNTLTEAIPGVTLDLVQAEIGVLTSLNITLDKNAIKSTIKNFAAGYNQVVGFITGQSVIDGEGGGLLSGDSGINTIKRHLQNMLTAPHNNDGIFIALSQLGFETQRDGTLIVNDEILSRAVNENLDSVISLLTNKNDRDGIASKFQAYLSSMTSAATGMLQGRRSSINSSVERMDERILSIEMRLEQREKTMRARFSAMEQLVSAMNAQSSFLSQQMDTITDIMNFRNR